MSDKMPSILSIQEKIIIKLVLLCSVLLFGMLVSAQVPLYTIDAHNVTYNVRIGHLKVGGISPSGTTLGANSSYFTKNDKPWFPVMGEFHYCRYPDQYWEEEIVKMKSAGLSIIATYVFWNAQEHPKGKWHWNGNLDLRRFVELCHKHGMYVWLRIGPWSHGEQLNGGFPEWIQKMKGRRTNDPGYLKEVGKLFTQIGEQTKGLYFKEGGPVIGVQLENEYANGQLGHIANLKKMALAAGIQPVYFSVTANTVFDSKNFEVIPLQGAYPYRGWEKGGGGPTKDFLYLNDQWIMTNALEKMYYDVTQYPMGLCEQGCGSQMTYANRFVVNPRVVEAHLQNQIGRGMNLVGYYMFHGGTQMPGLKEPGYPESYDFQAPISEFGLLRPSYKYLKILHDFILDFGEDLARTAVVYPAHPVMNERNTDSLRYVARVRGKHGYIFLCNTQVRIPMPDKTFRLRVRLPDEIIEFPRNELHFEGQTTAILPFNLNMNNVLLKYATVQPLARINKGKEQFVFFTEIPGMNVELAFDANTIRSLKAENWNQQTAGGKIVLTPENKDARKIEIVSSTGQRACLVLLTRQQAENSWRAKINNQERLVISQADLMFYGDSIECRQLDDPDIAFDVFPGFDQPVHYNGREVIPVENSIFRHYGIQLPHVSPDVTMTRLSKDKMVVNTPGHLPPTLSDIILKIEYWGGRSEAWTNGQIATDNLFNGQPWTFGLKRYLKELSGKGVEFKVMPWSDKITGVPDSLVQQVKNHPGEIESVKVIPQYRVKLAVE